LRRIDDTAVDDLLSAPVADDTHVIQQDIALLSRICTSKSDGVVLDGLVNGNKECAARASQRVADVEGREDGDGQGCTGAGG
jgi:hypothetical protein